MQKLIKINLGTAVKSLRKTGFHIGPWYVALIFFPWTAYILGKCLLKTADQEIQAHPCKKHSHGCGQRQCGTSVVIEYRYSARVNTKTKQIHKFHILF